MKTFPAILICRNTDGLPTSYPANISCTSEQQDEREYIDVLAEKAEAEGFIVDTDIPMVVNPGDPLWETFTYTYDENDWKNAPTITL
jgi:hypothetical protein